ncbi:hypothetical protein LPJ75_007418 [Coemansia sp. RSA 2598]|nr:hypothetical protein LPJ75_007418 [Coemansia sp. RSA 2598]
MSDEHYMAPPRDLAAASAKHGLAENDFVAPQFGKTYLYDIQQQREEEQVAEGVAK